MKESPVPMNASTAREEAIFTGALGKLAAERGAFLERECGADAALRQRVEALLASARTDGQRAGDRSPGHHTGELERTLKVDFSSKVVSVAFLDDDRRLVCLIRGGGIRIWNIDQARPDDILAQLRRSTTATEPVSDGRLVFSSNGELLAVLCPNAVAGVFEVGSLRRVASIPDSREVLGFGPVPRTLFIDHTDRRLALWDVNADPPRELSHMKMDLNRDVQSPCELDLASDGHSVGRLVFNNKLGKWMAQLWDFSSGKMVFEVPIIGIPGNCALRFAPDGKTFFTDGVRQWSSMDGQLLRIIPQGGGGEKWSFSSLSNGPLLALTTLHGLDIELYDITKGVFRPSLKGHGQASIMTLSPDGQTLGGSSRDGSLRLWSPSMGLELASFRLNIPSAEDRKRRHGVWALAFSPDGNVLAAVLDDGGVLGHGVLRLFRALPLAKIDNP